MYSSIGLMAIGIDLSGDSINRGQFSMPMGRFPCRCIMRIGGLHLPIDNLVAFRNIAYS